MTSRSNDAASVAQLQQQLAEACLSAEQAQISADQLKLDNDRSVAAFRDSLIQRTIELELELKII